MSILKEANLLKETLINHRRYIHQNAEVHLDLPLTSTYVKERLIEMGYEPQTLGSSGLTAIAGGKKPGKTFLIRADMDALPINEEVELEFKSNTGNMHACGHDFHTAMLLGAAQLLKNHEDELEGRVKLMFQPAEETLSGAKMMIENGLLENPKVDAAMMIHVITGMPIPSKTILIPAPGITAAAADWFIIRVKGQGCHGAMPSTGVDPLNVISHIHIALQEILAREVSSGDAIAMTIGQMHGGATSNVIPDTAYMTGTIRTMSNEVRDFAKKRLKEISEGIGATFRATVEVEFERGCPCMVINRELNEEIKSYTMDIFGESNIFDMSQLASLGNAMGSEDFAYIAEAVPTTSYNLSAGSPKEGYHFPLHHPKAAFDEESLPVGAALYANSAMEWLKHHP